MKKYLIQKTINKIRNSIPLFLRIKIGPIFAYIFYFFRVYIMKDSGAPKILTIEQTIDLIKKEKLSVIRFGDGEISLIDNVDLTFQKHNVELAGRLKHIIKINKNGLLICIPGIWGKMSNFNKKDFIFHIHHLFKHGHIWKGLLSTDRVYGNTLMTRPYLVFKNKSHANNTFNKIISLWEKEDVVLIEGEKSRLGVGNDLFNNVISIKRILCPAENAFSKYGKILEEAKKINKKKLILISLGPTAKLLAYDLFLLGYRVIDIGHIDMEYEMFLRKENKLIKVPYKYFLNLVNNPDDCKDVEYTKQIIVNIK